MSQFESVSLDNSLTKHWVKFSLGSAATMSLISKIKLGNQEIDALEVDFDIHREDWDEYKLLDGGTVRIKTTVTRIYKAVDEEGNQRYLEDGSPFMIVTHKLEVITKL